MSAYEWARQQIEESDLDAESKERVRELYTVWEKFVFASGDPNIELVLDAFSGLARGHAIERGTPPEFVWIPAEKAKPRQKDVVRVRRDAFPTWPNRELNGRVGVVARLSRGTLVIAFEGRGTAHIHPELLEARIPAPTD